MSIFCGLQYYLLFIFQERIQKNDVDKFDHQDNPYEKKIVKSAINYDFNNG